jgi:hypothetical protein
MCYACVPASAETIRQLYPHARVLLDIADISGFPPMFRDYPELVAHSSVAYWRAARPSSFATGGLRERISWHCQSKPKQEFNGRVEQIPLECVDNPAFHFSASSR